MKSFGKSDVYHDFESEYPYFANRIRKLLDLIRDNLLKFNDSDTKENFEDYQEVYEMFDYAIFVGSPTHEDMERMNQLWEKHVDIYTDQSGSCHFS